MAHDVPMPYDEPDDRFVPLVYVSHTAGMPPDAERMGLDRNVPDGALLGMAGSLDARKPLHRFVAWALLVAFCVPLAITAWNLVF